MKTIATSFYNLHIKYAFLTCYDFYFYEMYPSIARERPDIIIGCSHQRSDTANALETITKFLAYHTNAYVLRSSVSMGENEAFGGCSMAVNPKGEVLCNFRSKVGSFVVEFDPKEKYYKPMGFGNGLGTHFEYIEQGRRPYFYQPSGSMMLASDSELPYPRICAHRGFNTVLPENCMASYGAAIAMGAEEIEFDLWTSKDGVLVSCHDERLDRTSNGEGKIGDFTYEELLNFDFGSKHSPYLEGMQIATFEEILKKFACTAIMNIHVKIWDICNQAEHKDDDIPKIEEIISLIRKYGAEKHVYFMSGCTRALKKAKELAPDIHVCQGAGNDAWNIVESAIDIGAEKVQLFKPYFNQEMIDKAHAHGIKCNVFWADDPIEVTKFLEMGIDTILSNNYWQARKARDIFIKKS